MTGGCLADGQVEHAVVQALQLQRDQGERVGHVQRAADLPGGDHHLGAVQAEAGVHGGLVDLAGQVAQVGKGGALVEDHHRGNVDARCRRLPPASGCAR